MIFLQIHLPNTLAHTPSPLWIGSTYGIGLFLRARRLMHRLLTAASVPSGKMDVVVHILWSTPQLFSEHVYVGIILDLITLQ